jgi:hypothetical protein
MSGPPEFLYPLLPAFIRSADALQGEPLRALMSVLELQYRAIEGDLGQLYENWFIETCEEWVVPYIADLLGVRGLSGAASGVFSLRSRVANAIAHRRRKGTPSALACVVQDGTGWSAVAVECRDRISRTWSGQDPLGGSPGNGTLSLRNLEALKTLEDPLSTVGRGADLLSLNRSPEDRFSLAGARGRYNLPNLGVLLWRLQQYPVVFGAPRRTGPANGYTFSPLGVDRPLFALQPPPEGSGTPGGDAGIPGPLDPRLLTSSRGRIRRGLGAPEETPAVQIFVLEGGKEPAWREVPAREIAAADLSGWRAAGSSQVLIDPALGRLLFPRAPQGEVRVSYSYGFSTEIGGGPYARRSAPPSPPEEVLQAAVSWDAPEERLTPSGPWEREEESGLLLYRTLGQALEAWRKDPHPRALIRILDSAVYDVRELSIQLSSSHHELVIEAASGQCPCLIGDLALDTRMETDTAQRASVTLGGLWIDGQVGIQGGGRLCISHCTLRPPAQAGDRDSLTVLGDEGLRELEISVEASIVGRVALPPHLLGLSITDSIVDGGRGPSLCGLAGSNSSRASGPPATIARSTLFGPAAVLRLNASSSLLTAPVQVRDPREGGAAFSYLAPGSTGLRREHCQPEAGDATVRPFFTSTRFGDPGYAQLSRQTPAAIAAGGEDGSEMGVFHGLSQPQRLANLPAILEEYVPWGLDAWVELVT